MSAEPARRAAFWRTDGLLLRSTLAVLLASLLAAAVAVSYTAADTRERAQMSSQTRLNELLDTISSTLAVACFANDQTLAVEVAQGLLSNSDVLAVRIATGYTVLADLRRAGRAPGAGAGLIERLIYSPFDGQKQVGHILLTPDPLVMEQRIRDEVWLAGVQLSWQLGMVTFAVVLMMLVFIVRPIKAISDRLHQMDPTSGERLAPPRRHKGTEIGLLVADINALADRLTRVLDTERQLRLQREVEERKYHTIFDNAESGLFLMDQDGSLISWNPAFAKLFGIEPPRSAGSVLTLHQLPWQNPAQLQHLVQDALTHNAAVAQDLQISLATEACNWVNLVLRAVGNHQLQGVVHDISHLKASEASAQRLAVTDPLTGLPNRLGLEQRLTAHLQRGSRSGALDAGFALLMVDLDEFRRINEGMGLPAGDNVLQITARRLAACLASDDTLARLAADRFCIILNQLTRDEVADRVAERISHSIRQPYFVEGSPVNLHASMGIALFPSDGVDLPSLLRQAELAMDKAKSNGGDGHVFFNPLLTEAAEQRRQLESDLRSAIRQQEFVLYYQPIIDLRARRLVGAEALIRWQHPTRGLIPPDSFIALAEKTGLVVDISLQMLNTACEQLGAWNSRGLDYTLSLNVSGRQIPDGLSPQTLQEVVQRHGIAPQRLALEITEGVMLRDIDKSLDWVHAVHAYGFKVYLDDFGTGYSSLSYLKRFPVDTLKVDKSFVQDMQDDNNEYTLVGAIIAMGRSLGLEVVAEGVESPAQWRALQRMGCHYAQGYYFSQPVAAADFDAVAHRVAQLLHPLPERTQPAPPPAAAVASHGH